MSKTNKMVQLTYMLCQEQNQNQQYKFDYKLQHETITPKQKSSHNSNIPHPMTVKTSTNFNIKGLKLVLVLLVIIISSESHQKKTSNPYAVLGISRDATQEQIKARFRQLSKQYHPDKISRQRQAGQRQAGQSLDEGQRNFQEIVQAYEKLKRNDFISSQYYHDQDDGQYEDRSQKQRHNYEHSFFNLDSNILSMKVFFDILDMEWGQQEQEYKQQKYKEINFYNFSIHFVTWALRNKMVMMGAFLISLGLLTLIYMVRKETMTKNK